MKIQNIHNGVVNEITKQEWEKLGKSQKVFRVLDEKDSPKLRDQSISNGIGKTVTKEPVKPEKKK